jgi:hypothetical protein
MGRGPTNQVVGVCGAPYTLTKSVYRRPLPCCAALRAQGSTSSNPIQLCAPHPTHSGPVLRGISSTFAFFSPVSLVATVLCFPEPSAGS